jgi:hypothetical protein
VYLVCVFAFDLFIVFILVPRHKSRESMKIGPHPRGHHITLLGGDLPCCGALVDGAASGEADCW